MKTALIGHTGFIGSNLAKQFQFDEFYNSKNIQSIRGREFDLVVCAGVQGKMWWADQNPKEDLEKIKGLIHCLGDVRAMWLSLISTVDVYSKKQAVDENSDLYKEPSLRPYGLHRLFLEIALNQLFGSNICIFRPCKVYGPGLKKNIIFDLMHNRPLYQITLDSCFQFYNVRHLWDNIVDAMEDNLHSVNLVTEPISVARLVEEVFPEKANSIDLTTYPGTRERYDVRTIHRPSGYLSTAEEVISEIKEFVHETGSL